MRNVIATLFMLTCSLPAFAVEPPKGGMCGGIGMFGPNNKDGFFDCEHLGRVTVKQIYERGWRVVSSGFQPLEADAPVRSYMYLIIEQRTLTQ